MVVASATMMMMLSSSNSERGGDADDLASGVRRRRGAQSQDATLEALEEEELTKRDECLKAALGEMGLFGFMGCAPEEEEEGNMRAMMTGKGGGGDDDFVRRRRRRSSSRSSGSVVVLENLAAAAPGGGWTVRGVVDFILISSMLCVFFSMTMMEGGGGRKKVPAANRKRSVAASFSELGKEMVDRGVVDAFSASVEGVEEAMVGRKKKMRDLEVAYVGGRIEDFVSLASNYYNRDARVRLTFFGNVIRSEEALLSDERLMKVVTSMHGAFENWSREWGRGNFKMAEIVGEFMASVSVEEIEEARGKLCSKVEEGFSAVRKSLGIEDDRGERVPPTIVISEDFSMCRGSGWRDEDPYDLAVRITRYLSSGLGDSVEMLRNSGNTYDLVILGYPLNSYTETMPISRVLINIQESLLETNPPSSSVSSDSTTIRSWIYDSLFHRPKQAAAAADEIGEGGGGVVVGGTLNLFYIQSDDPTDAPPWFSDRLLAPPSSPPLMLEPKSLKVARINEEILSAEVAKACAGAAAATNPASRVNKFFKLFGRRGGKSSDTNGCGMMNILSSGRAVIQRVSLLLVKRRHPSSFNNKNNDGNIGVY